MSMTRIAVAAALSLALSACGERDEHDVQAASGSAPAADARPAEAGAAAPMSVAATPARIAALATRTTDCNLESVNGVGFEPDVPTAARNAPVVVSGWLVDMKAGVVPAAARLRIESADGSQAWEQPILEWGDRGDVVAARGGNAAFQKSGFSTTLQVGALPAATYEIYLDYDSPSGAAACAVGRRLTLE